MRRIFALVLVAVFVGVSLATVGSSDLSGVWAQLVVSSQLSDVPFAGRVRQQTSLDPACQHPTERKRGDD
jgi:hypothetical protein